MIKEKTAVFIGHRDCHFLETEVIRKEIIKLIKIGVTSFLNGGQGKFDILCAECVNELKKEYPYIELNLIIPYPNFNIFNKNLFDNIIYPEGLEKYHYKGAIPARNKYMVNNSNYAICYVCHGFGGAAKSLEYAVKKDLTIINLGDLPENYFN